MTSKQWFVAALIGLTVATAAQSQLLRREGESGRRPGVSRAELNAKNIIDSAIEAFENGQDDRGVKALEQVIMQYPNTRARFRALLLLGEHHMKKRNYDQAIVELRKVATSEDDAQLSQALCWIGTCHYEQTAYDKAVSALRQVINNYPGTTAANDAYYYIGLCHYHRKRWGKAMQAFEMVGTAVADREDQGQTLAEAGRRLFVRVRDKDLPVQARLGKDVRVMVQAKSGDVEHVPLEPVGRTREDFVASVRTTTEPSEPDDGLLRVRGGDQVTVTYIDQNTLKGSTTETRLAEVTLVSTAGLAITDGAYRQSVGAVALDQPVFVRLKDLDLDTTAKPDEVRIEVISKYKVKQAVPEVGEGSQPRGGVDLDQNDRAAWTERSRTFITLTESSPTSGLFLGRFVPYTLGGANDQPPAGKLAVRAGDTVETSYTDKRHLGGDEAITLAADVLIVETGQPEVETMISVSSNPQVQTRKLLLEAQLRQMLAQIFQDMGLLDRAKEKSDDGLERVEQVLKMHAVNPLPRSLVEQAFEAKWNLYLAQADVQQAIATCKALLELYPKSTLADQAFLKIGQAYYESDDAKEVAKAIPVLQMVVNMKGALSQAEASYLLGLVKERLGALNTSDHHKSLLHASSVAQFMSCAEQFPDSPFAADALKKVIKYYYDQKDYPRASELLERICRDYQDQDWLHKMYLTWGVVHLRMNHRDAGIEKLQQVIEEYPESDSAVTASQLLGKMGVGGGESPDDEDNEGGV